MPRPSLYEQLRHEIITLRIPPGTDLDEQSLVKRFNKSRTPIRESLIRLSAEGLVEIRKNRGATVTPLDLHTLQSIFEAGDLIEKAFTRLACLRRTDEDLQLIGEAQKQFTAGLEEGNISAIVESNSKFHLSIAQGGKNKYFVESYRRILADHERISQMWYSEQISMRNHSMIETIDKQHKNLYKAILDRDTVTAERVTLEHSSFCKEGVRESLVSGESVIADINFPS